MPISSPGESVVVERNRSRNSANAFAFPRTPTLVFLVAATIGTIVTGSLVVARFRDALVKTEQRLYFHTWLLRQFLPDKAYDDVVPGTTSLSSLPRAARTLLERSGDRPG